MSTTYVYKEYTDSYGSALASVTINHSTTTAAEAAAKLAEMIVNYVDHNGMTDGATMIISTSALTQN